MSEIQYDANPPVFRNNPLIFIVFVVAVVLAGALSADVPQLILAVVAVGILVWLLLFVLSKSKRLTITTHEVRYESGILAKDRTEIGLGSIRSIRVDQSFVQRILGVATLEFFSAGDKPEIRIEGMPDPHKVRDLIDGK